MRACIFIFSLFLFSVSSTWIHAEEGKTTSADLPEEEDYKSTPYTTYGEFHDLAEEEKAERFFQYGRFFGVSIAVGYRGVTGNRGLLWEGGFPLVELKVHAWVDFQFSVALVFQTSSHQYTESGSSVSVTLFQLGAELKYYFNVTNLSAPLTFIHPYLLGGIGSFSKSEFNTNLETKDLDTSFGFTLGGGLEFVVSPKSSYIYLEAKIHQITFQDTQTTRFQTTPGIADLSGMFYSATLGYLFTW